MASEDHPEETGKKRRRLSLGWLSAAIGAAGVIVASTIAILNFVRQPPPPDPEVVAYQKQVVATCGRVQAILAVDHTLEIVDISNPRLGPLIKKDGLVRVTTTTLAQVRNEFDLLNARPTPGGLSDKKHRAVQAEAALYGTIQDDVRFIQNSVRDREPLTEFDAQFATRATNELAATSRLSAALSDLAGSECRLRAPSATGAGT
jgi:hypothetical protein